MRTLGVDLAAAEKKTAAAVIEWADGAARLAQLSLGVGDEEIVRLRGHFEHWRQLTVAAEPCGRKLDFLVQEMNREINTIGSKVESGKGTEIVISAKAELERVREQIQNVE